MSTRATYDFGKNRCIYIHYDGYPSGAAGYFRAAYAATYVEGLGAGGGRGRGGWYYNFIRGNPLAEPTESHDAHGDTEYRYTLLTENRPEAFVQVHEKDWDRVGKEEWRGVFCGPVRDFVNWGALDGLKRNIAYREGNNLPPDPFAAELCEIVGHARLPGVYGAEVTLEAPHGIAVALAAAYTEKAHTFAVDNPNRDYILIRAGGWQACADNASEIFARDFQPLIDAAAEAEANRKRYGAPKKKGAAHASPRS